MTDIDKAARGIVTLVCAVLSLTAGSVADAWQAHLDALTAADMAAGVAAFAKTAADANMRSRRPRYHRQQQRHK